MHPSGARDVAPELLGRRAQVALGTVQAHVEVHFQARVAGHGQAAGLAVAAHHGPRHPGQTQAAQDRKSTRLNSSHLVISYAVFCLKKKKNQSTTLKSFLVSFIAMLTVSR